VRTGSCSTRASISSSHRKRRYVHSSNGWKNLLEPIIHRYRETKKKLYFRADAAFASPDVYEYLEDNRILYAIRIPSNQNLQREIDHLLTRPVGRPPKRPRVFYHDSPTEPHRGTGPGG
jgi:Transposase DDE domain group 1